MLPDNPYNILPFFIILILYVVSWILMKRKVIKKPYFTFFWNTVMLIALIPMALFGYIMIGGYSYDFLSQINFDFRYWHVQGGMIFSAFVIAHFLTRFASYISPLRNIIMRSSHSEEKH